MRPRAFHFLRRAMMRSVFVRVWVLTWRERFPLIGLGFLTLLLPPAVFAVPQGVPQGALKGPHDHEQSPPPSGLAQPNAGNPTPLSALIEEARKNDPAIHVAESAARA